jgi:hypothetical protein
MGLLLAITAGLVIWIVGWALGLKSFDVFLVTALIILLGATVRMLAPFFPGRESDPDI